MSPDYNTPPSSENPSRQPEYPPYPQYPQGYPNYAQSGYPGPYYAPVPPQQRSGLNAGCWIGLGVGIGILVCILACVGSVFAFGAWAQTQGNSILQTLPATETALAVGSPTATVNETVLYTDSLTDSPVGWTNGSGCKAESDGFHVAGGAVCLAPSKASSSNVDVTVTVQGGGASTTTVYAVVLRWTSKGNYYAVEVTPDGEWGVLKYVNGVSTPVLQFQSSTAIQTGASSTNTIRVLLVGSHFVVSINGQSADVANDSTYTTGRVGLANDDSDTSSDIVFTNLTVAQPQ